MEALYVPLIIRGCIPEHTDFRPQLRSRDQTQAFAFFIKHFHLTADSTEIPVGQCAKTFDELKGGDSRKKISPLSV